MSFPSPTEVIQPIHWLVTRSQWLFFSGTSAAELGFHRILFYGVVLSLFLRGDVSLWAHVSEVFWQPTYFFRVLDLPVLPGSLLLALGWIWRAALCFAALGLFTRLSTWVTFVLGFYLLGLPHNFGKVHHGDAIVVIGLAIFAFSRCGDGWSLDALVRAASSRGTKEPAPRAGSTAGATSRSGEYSWPLHLYRLMLTLALFAAGVAKARHAGVVAWVLSDNLYYNIIRHHYTHTPTDIGLLFVRSPRLCRVLAGSALGLEFLTPALLVLPVPWRMLFLAAILAMMLGFGLALGVWFTQLMALLALFFLPWRELGEWLARSWAGRRPTVLYDGACGLCTRTIAVIRSLDVLGRVHAYDMVADEPQLATRFPGLNRQDCLETMHVVAEDGRVATGFYAYRALAWSLPLGWVVLPFLYLPGVPFAGGRVYVSIARRRHGDRCPLPKRTASPSPPSR